MEENFKGCAKDGASPIELGDEPDRVPVTLSTLIKC